MPTAFVLPAREEQDYEWPIAEHVVARFWTKVATGVSMDCWEWQAFKNPRGYGMFRNGRRMALAHRVAWVIEHGRVPLGLQVLHHCDNPACVNVAHLYVGTNDDNVRDKVERGRSHFANPWRQGEKHHGAKLTDDDVREIRRRSTRAVGEGRAFAREFGVSDSTISNVLNGKVWKHLS